MKKQTVERLKQTYAIINQALDRAEVDYGERSSWGANRDWGYDCIKSSDSFNCSALIMLDGWKISNDYPWGKTAISY